MRIDLDVGVGAGFDHAAGGRDLQGVCWGFVINPSGPFAKKKRNSRPVLESKTISACIITTDLGLIVCFTPGRLTRGPE